ncbi:histidine kinase [Syntrophotalea acetylenivorans]|uniref:Histidine kinase n=1 Tax=Syntrophotalea acetylenivorans TaxID=1842532 RepID=A0A1L3GSH5_9BACT|nr:sigma-54 dependent transcriptional regulator [Syntrophotalea acetylenivorans]APG28904.1 histidine kinase [Syntrophotalea acetylenivorans]
MGTKKKKVLVVDDETSVRHMLRLVLEGAGYEMCEAGSGTEALQFLQDNSFDIILSDIRMPELDGLGLLQQIKELGVDSMVIMMSAYGSVDTAVECLKHGAYDYISKPFKPDEVILTLRKAEERIRLQRENVRLRQQLSQKNESHKIVCRSKVMDRLLTLVTRVAETNSPVLITGETGTGKELIARALHQQSARAKKPFIAVNCGAIAPSLVESELFGHARGAFTGAVQQKAGLFEEASGGTLFLDEIGELPMDLQPKLLRVLQEGEVRRVGENRSRKVDVRVLAATARDLRKLVANGKWRDDLFFRLAVVEMHIPPLRERREDIVLLAKHFASGVAAREGRPTPEITPGVADTLKNYSWPGNVRELANFMEKTMIFCRNDVLDLETLPGEMRRRDRDATHKYSLKEAALRLEKEYIRKALAATDGNRTQAAKLLEISLRKLLYKIKEYEIE